MERILRTEIVNAAPKALKRARKRLMLKPADQRPAITPYTDLFAFPNRNGLYDGSGRRVEAANLILLTDSERAAPRYLAKIEAERAIWSPPTVDIAQEVRKAGGLHVEECPAIFFGNSAVHYGHWLMDYAARLWAADEVRPDERPVLPPSPGVDACLDAPHIAALLQAARLTGPPSRRLARAVHFKSIRVVEPAQQLGLVAFRVADTIHRRAARELLGAATQDFRGARIHLSRKRHVSQIRTVLNEDAVEAMFRARGYTTIYPETLSLADQVALFNQAQVIAGAVGSAFHTGMFSLSDFRGTLLVLCAEEAPNGRLLLQHALKQYRAIHLCCGTYVPRQDGKTAQLTLDVPTLIGQLDSLDLP